MYRHHHWQDEDSEDKTAERQTGGLVGLAVVLLLLVGGLFLVQQLRTASIVEDCLLSGRTNCDALVSQPH
ncbi:MAG: hypothetical protein QOD93_2046 [Acetobacteraceae bacterium]|nr:hypothetical protein [Rhodopila sp.]MEA2733510.1 hypothetical protein [Acetobacteraceae bacterium]MEA2769084.1 hypothetical protein [Acetobacteraceae bacterium]